VCLATGRRTTVRLLLTPRARRLVRRGDLAATITTFAATRSTVAVQRRIGGRR
jgi:hypothetical protein